MVDINETKNERIGCVLIMLTVLFINFAVLDYLSPNHSINNQFTYIKQFIPETEPIISIANTTKTSTDINGIVLFTVPKCGTHFLSDIVTLFIDINTNIYNRSKMRSIVPHCKDYTQIGDSKFLSTHQGWISFSYFLNNHYNMIIAIRNPIDMTISGYFYYELREPEKKQLSIYNYTLANIKRNSKTILKYYQYYANNMNRCMLNKFEDLIFDFDSTVKRIYQFISIFETLDTPNYDLIANMLDFKTVHRQEKQNGIYKVGSGLKTLFHRSGKVGQAATHFTNKQIATITKRIPSDIYEIYPKHMYLNGINTV